MTIFNKFFLVLINTNIFYSNENFHHTLANVFPHKLSEEEYKLFIKKVKIKCLKKIGILL